MGRQQQQQHQQETAALHSSIALLQERFRQLQRTKEMREERELIKVFAEAHAEITTAATTTTTPPPTTPTTTTNRCDQQPKWFVHPDLVHPSKPLHGPPVSLRLEPHSDSPRGFQQPLETQLSMGLWPNTRMDVGFRAYCDHMDVDTSLHL